MPRLRPDHFDVPLPERLSARHRRFEELMRRHREAVAAGLPAYLDPATGQAVFTAAFLAERGYCCDSGCRHCPYERHERPDR